MLPLTLKNLFNTFFLIQTRLKNNLKKKYSQNYNFFIIKIKKKIKNNKKLFNKFFIKKTKPKINLYINESLSALLLNFELKKQNFKKYKN